MGMVFGFMHADLARFELRRVKVPVTDFATKLYWTFTPLRQIAWEFVWFYFQPNTFD